ncbi:MAG TPA: hypothetical protein VL283_05675 [Candidatus Baltobacteraceae bacterium]|nr:hypothetical protein [Candidatus Baltobacteraceae bacterium]
MSRTYVTLALTLLAACGNSGPDPLHDYSKCGGPTTIAIANADVVDGDGIALPKGVEVDLVIEAKDAEGDYCDPTDLELSLDDPDQIEIVSAGEATVLKARYDAIDRGAEPTTVLHASLGGVEASWPVASVVALGGTWSVTITEYTRYPDGYEFGEVVFTQRGRRMVWEDCTISVVCSRDAAIRGAAFTAEAPEYGLMISAPIDPDRNRFAGPWSAKDGDYQGDFVAVRVD